MFDQQSETWERARTEDKKEARRLSILQSAYSLFHDLSYHEVSFNAITRETGLSKSSVYLYYSNKEEIFMDIFMESFQKWIANTISAWSELPVESSPQDIIKTWLNVSWNDQKLRDLAPILSTSIENNISPEKMADCLKMKKQEVGKLHLSLSQFSKNLSAEQVFKLMLCMFNLFGQFASYEDNRTLMQAFEMDEHVDMKIDFREAVLEAMTDLYKAAIEKS